MYPSLSDLITNIGNTPQNGSNTNNLVHIKPNANVRKLKANTNILNMLYQNVRGLNTKIEDFFFATTSCSFDLLLITETWLNSSVFTSELFPQNFNVIKGRIAIVSWLEKLEAVVYLLPLDQISILSVLNNMNLAILNVNPFLSNLTI